MDWYDVTDKYHELTIAEDGRLESLPEVWQRELAAVSRLEADVNNGGYLQFITNWGEESYRYGLAALQNMGANKMARIISDCQSTLAAAVNIDKMSPAERHSLMPNQGFDLDGNEIKEAGSILQDSTLQKVYDLSYEFMDYPDDLPELGLKYYTPFIQR